MSESTARPSELTSQYVNQVTGDLERNVKEQERITAELATLQEQLAVLQQDHSVLVNMQKALGTAAAPTVAPAGTDSAVVPSPRRKKAASPGAGRSRKTATARSGGEKETAKKATAATSPSKTAQPTLVELVRRHLTEQSEPRSAAEVAEALTRAHPKRAIQTNVVRTTLESLVARNKAQRSKQGSSVFYTASDASVPAAAPKAEAQPEAAG